MDKDNYIIHVHKEFGGYNLSIRGNGADVLTAWILVGQKMAMDCGCPVQVLASLFAHCPTCVPGCAVDLGAIKTAVDEIRRRGEDGAEVGK